MKRKSLEYIKSFFMMMSVGITTVLLSMPLVYAAEKLQYLKCGDNFIPAPIAPITRVLTLLLQILLPLVIILVGNMDFLKAVIASDQEKIKKNQRQFFNRLKAALIFFLVITVFKFVIQLVADTKEDSDDFIKCVDCLISDESSCDETTDESPFKVPYED